MAMGMVTAMGMGETGFLIGADIEWPTSSWIDR